MKYRQDPEGYGPCRDAGPAPDQIKLAIKPDTAKEPSVANPHSMLLRANKVIE